MSGTTRRRLTATTAVALLVALLALPAGAAEGPVGPDLSVPRAPSLSDEQRAEVAAAVAAASAPTDERDGFRGASVLPPPPALLAPAQTTIGDVYEDFCGDTGGARPDLRRAIVFHRDAQTLTFVAETCQAVQPTDLDGGVSLLLRHGTSSFAVMVQRVGAQVVGSVVDTTTGQVRHVGTGGFVQGADNAFGLDFPKAAIGSPAAFTFTVEARNAAGAVVDVMPEAGEEVGVFPGSCQPLVLAHRTVTAAPGQLDQALAAARGVGLLPTAVDGRSGTFDVALAEAGHERHVRALPGVADIAPAVRFAGVSTAGAGDEATATPANATAWWRQRVRTPTGTAGPTGAGVRIAVIDNGVDGTRAELAGRVARGFDTARNRVLQPGANSDRGGHGTLVAGVAASSPTSQVTGIAPGATIRPYQTFTFDNCASNTAIAAAIDRAVADGVDIINLSVAGAGPTHGVLAAALQAARQAGVLVVAAAGNDGLSNAAVAPADHPAALAVAATDANDARAPYSNRASWVELAAPGGNGTTDATGIRSLGERGGTQVVNGTSFAAPIVAGAAALYLEVSGADAEATRAALAATAVDLGTTGRDTSFGFGLLDITALLAAAPEPATPPAPVAGIRDIGPTCANARTGRFPDVPASHAHRAGIDCLAHYAVAGGFGDGSYRPDRSVTRGQMATFIANMIRETGGSLPTPTRSFGDVPTDHAHRDSIRRLATAEIVGGFPDGSFRPDALVTRDQMATFLTRALEYRADLDDLPTGTAGFTDITGNRHEAAIQKAAAAGLTGGVSATRYGPRGEVTRGQMGSFLARTIAWVVDAELTTPR